MWKLLTLFGALLCLSLTAAANDSTGALEATSPDSQPAAPAPVPLYPTNRDPWQVGAGFQYQHFQPYNLSFHNLGYNAEISRYFNNWLGIEAAIQTGFGHTETTPVILRSLDAKSFFIGGGPHLVLTNRSRIEPWFHGLVGLEHFRFTETNNSLGLGSTSTVGFMLGGGVDFKVKGSVFWRVEANYIGSDFPYTFQNNYSLGTGLIINF